MDDILSVMPEAVIAICIDGLDLKSHPRGTKGALSFRRDPESELTLAPVHIVVALLR